MELDRDQFQEYAFILRVLSAEDLVDQFDWSVNFDGNNPQTIGRLNMEDFWRVPIIIVIQDKPDSASGSIKIGDNELDSTWVGPEWGNISEDADKIDCIIKAAKILAVTLIQNLQERVKQFDIDTYSCVKNEISE